MTNIIHIDYETFSKADLPRVGGHRYARDPSTEILCIGIALNDEEPMVWFPRMGDVFEQEDSEQLFDMLIDPTTLVYAHNATGFEIPITDALFERTTGFKPPAHHQWRCTAAMARKAALPSSLEKLAEALKLTQQKDNKGKALIRKFCIPQKATKPQLAKGKHVPERVLPSDDPEAFAAFVEYCRQDVRTEQAVHETLKDFELTGGSLQTFQLDIAINCRGLPVNVDGIKKAIALVDQETARIAAEFRKITGFEHTQGKVFLPWLVERGYTGTNLKADTIEEELELDDAAEAELECDMTSMQPEAQQALKLKQQIAFASLKKLPAMLACAGPDDNRVRGCLVYHGATTGRWAAKNIQPMNFKRPTIPFTEQAYKFICDGATADEVALVFDEPLKVVSSCIRHFIHDYKCDWTGKPCERCKGTGLMAERGEEVRCSPCGGTGDEHGEVNRPMLDADYAAIEARIAPWLAGQEDALQEYRDGLDRYKVMASIIFKVKYEDVTKDQRFLGKIAILGLGYGMGPTKFYDTCIQYGVEGITMELAQKAVDAYRKKHDKIRAYWYALERTLKNAINMPGTRFTCGKVQAYSLTTAGMLCLFIELPSKRKLCYPMPEVVDDRITFYGQRPGTVHWGRVDTYGAKMFENIDQGVAADIMSNGAIKAEREGYEIYMLVHDEAVSGYKPESGQSIEEFVRLLTTLPGWADGLPVEAEGDVVPFYKK